MSERIVVPQDRIIERTQGCWNCIHFSHDLAIKKWTHKRQQDLSKGLNIAMSSPLKEDDPKVRNIRHMVDTLDKQIAAGVIGTCTNDGETAVGAPVGDFVVANYLCHKWSAAQGASIARAGQKADDLPEEVADKLDGGPMSMAELGELTKKEVE